MNLNRPIPDLLERMAVPTSERRAVLMIPHRLAARYGRAAVLLEAHRAARRWGFAGVRVVWIGPLPPVPAKAAHRRRYGR